MVAKIGCGIVEATLNVEKRIADLERHVLVLQRAVLVLQMLAARSHGQTLENEELALALIHLKT
jgi:hypothetical protein